MLRFADFEIDVAQQELRRRSQIVHMEPQVFDLLLHLVRHRERIVSKDELIETIWNGRIVSEAALSTCIKAARKAIGDNGNDQLLIRTLRKRGFRFVAAVTEGAASIVRPPEAEAESRPRRATEPSRAIRRPRHQGPRLRFRRSRLVPVSWYWPIRAASEMCIHGRHGKVGHLADGAAAQRFSVVSIGLAEGESECNCADTSPLPSAACFA